MVAVDWVNMFGLNRYTPCKRSLPCRCFLLSVHHHQGLAARREIFEF